jgi:hypothetical protein
MTAPRTPEQVAADKLLPPGTHHDWWKGSGVQRIAFADIATEPDAYTLATKASWAAMTLARVVMTVKNADQHDYHPAWMEGQLGLARKSIRELEAIAQRLYVVVPWLREVPQ